MGDSNDTIDSTVTNDHPTCRRRQLIAALGVGSLLGPRAISTTVTAHTQSTPETVATFQPPNLPETITTDAEGNLYLSMAVTGDLIQLTPTGSQSTIASLTPNNGYLLGHTLTGSPSQRQSYALLNSRTSTTHGVWEIPHQSPGEPRRILQFRPDTILNDVVSGPNGTSLYISAARATSTGGGGGGARSQYSISENGYYWATGIPDQPTPTKHTPSIITGPNGPVKMLSLAGPTGITIHDGYLYVLNPHAGQLLRSQLTARGEPKETELVVEAPALQGGDGLAFDDAQTLYVAIPTQNQVVRVQINTPQPQVETVIATDAFDFPTDVAFAPTQTDSQTLYICNSALQTFQQAQNQQQGQQKPAPSIMKVNLSE